MLHALQRRRVERAFAGGNLAAGALGMRAHLAGCPLCRERYRRQLIAEAALPDGEERAGERLWREVERVAARPHPARPWLISLALATAAAAVLMIARPTPPVARGPAGAALAPSLHVFRASESGVEPVAGQIHAGDGLLFAYSNPGSAYSHLMVFAADQRGHVYWYYPAYQREGEDPRAVAIEPYRTGVELREVIRQPLPPGPLRLYALFLSTAEPVSAIEAQVARGEVRTPSGHQESWALEVLP
jgi:hypothetical protein